jgi:hypothetical protein
MQELPIQASVNEFVDLVHKDTGGTVACWACGCTVWDTFEADAPFALNAIRIRLDAPADDAMFGVHVVGFSCSDCGLLRFHQARPVFPPEAL